MQNFEGSHISALMSVYPNLEAHKFKNHGMMERGEGKERGKGRGKYSLFKNFYISFNLFYFGSDSLPNRGTKESFLR